MIRLRSPEIYVGLFDIEKVGSSTITEPIGVSYRYPNSNIVNIAVAERGFHHQLHNAYMYGFYDPDSRPLVQSDKVSAFAYQDIPTEGCPIEDIKTYVYYFAAGEQPDLSSRLRKKLNAQRKLAARVLAAVLSNEVYKGLPGDGTMHRKRIPRRILNSNPDNIMYCRVS